MEYIVRVNGKEAKSFLSEIGLLTGDSASPGLWNIFFSDFCLPPSEDDVLLDGVRINHLLQADDLMLLSFGLPTSLHNLQTFERYTARKAVDVSMTKNRAMVFGRVQHLPSLYIHGARIPWVDRHELVGVTLTSVRPNLFAFYYENLAAQASRASHGAFSAEAFVGVLSPEHGRVIFSSQVSPYLTAGADAFVDTQMSALASIEKPYHQFIRRLLRLPRNSQLHVLFSETGFIPLRHWRLILSLCFIKSVVQLSDGHFARAAFLDSVILALCGSPGFASDLVWALDNLPYPVHSDVRSLMTVAGLDTALSNIKQSYKDQLFDAMVSSTRSLLLWYRTPSDAAPKMRAHLRIKIPLYRFAYARLIASTHSFAVELLRRSDWRRQERMAIIRSWRTCRLCKGDVEDEAHALLSCPASLKLGALRAQFWEKVPHFPASISTDLLALRHQPPHVVLQRILYHGDRSVDFATIVGKLASGVMDVFESEPIYINPGAVYRPIS
ncbi:hypothetical protein DL93DRAFT_2058556 [Clavulina sp. PMI_390]|nr:hypothetical protein DL93DRAFT_2058556 [Clavulina sp. PMI_390]